MPQEQLYKLYFGQNYKVFLKDIYIIAFKGVNGFKNVSPGRFSEANNCDKFIKVTLVEICVYWKYLKWYN